MLYTHNNASTVLQNTDGMRNRFTGGIATIRLETNVAISEFVHPIDRLANPGEPWREDDECTIIRTKLPDTVYEG